MGFISEFAETKANAFTPDGREHILRRSPTDRGQGRRLWDDVFSGLRTNKEEGMFPKVRDDTRAGAGGAYARSLTTDASFKRLLQAMRSMAPGGWSDDRWEQTARHYNGIQYVTIFRTCEQMSQSEFQVFIKDDDNPEGKRPVTKKDPAEPGFTCKPYDLVELLEKPNRDDSFGSMCSQWNLQMDLTGMALTWMVPNQLGIPFELYPIPTAIAIPQAAINPDYPDGYYRIQPIYPYGPFSSYPTPSTAVGAPIPAQWMLKFKYPHPLLRYDGYSPLTALKLHLDEVEGMDKSRWYAMRRGIHPSAVLNFEEMEGAAPLPEPEIERIRAEFEAAQQGPENFGNLFVATPGSRLEQWGMRPVDMDYTAGWDQLVQFVMGGLGVPRPIVGMLNDVSYAALFATLKQFHLLTLKPKVDRFASCLTRHLAPFFGKNLIIEIRTPRIDDHDVKNAKLSLLAQAMAITKNEFRKELEMPLTEEDWGKQMAGEPPQPPPGAGGGLEALLGGMGGGGGQGGPGGQPGGPGGNPDEQQEPQEMAQGRPGPGNLGQGALGPRKGLKDIRNRYRNNRVKRIFSLNGNGRH